MKKTINLLVSLDMVLDTRLGTLARLDERLPTQVLQNGYHLRRSDFFDGVDKQAFDALYKARNVETLQASYATNLLPFLKQMVEKLTEKYMDSPLHESINIDLNVFPYVLDEEVAGYMASSVQTWIGPLATVRPVRITDTELTPKVVKDQYDKLFMYEYGQWLEMHTDAFEITRIPDVELYIPAIIFTEKPDDEKIAELTKIAMNPFEALQFGASLFIGLIPIDVGLFSIIAFKE